MIEQQKYITFYVLLGRLALRYCYQKNHRNERGPQKRAPNVSSGTIQALRTSSYGAGATVTVTQADEPVALKARIRKYHVVRGMLPLVNVVTFAAIVLDPVMEVKLLLLHWTMYPVS